MAKQDFKPVFDYIDKTKNDLEAKLASKEDVRRLEKAIQTKDYYQEVTVVVAKVSRIEAWIQKAADKVGIRYDR